jgi:hypothetical protein
MTALECEAAAACLSAAKRQMTSLVDRAALPFRRPSATWWVESATWPRAFRHFDRSPDILDSHEELHEGGRVRRRRFFSHRCSNSLWSLSRNGVSMVFDATGYYRPAQFTAAQNRRSVVPHS